MTEYLIWSNEHRAWWGPGRSGYVRRIEDAGAYSRKTAVKICADAIPGTSKLLGILPELPVRVEDAQLMMELFHGAYPGHDPEPAR